MIRVLYVGSGFCSARGMSADLPERLQNRSDVEIDVVVPHVDGIDEGVGKLAERLIDCSADVGGVKYDVKVLEGRRENHVRAYYMDSECLKLPLSLSSDGGILACSVFAHAVCRWIAQVPVAYDIVHCDGVLTSLIPTLMKTVYAADKCISSVKSVVVLAGIANKACVDMSWLSRIGLPDALGSSDGMEFYGKLSLLKGVYLYADAIAFPNGVVKNVVENNRGKDIGMEGLLFDRVNAIHAISLGSDLSKNSPDCGREIESAYSVAEISGKNKCKSVFAQKLHFKKDRPLVAFVGRLNSESGIDLVNDILDDLMDRQVSLVIAGEGNEAYNAAIEGWKSEFKGCVAWLKGRPSEAELRRLLSAADILLMPAKNEDVSRLHQIAMKYGCVVVARNQGCIANDIHAVSCLDRIDALDNGFAFDDYDSDQFFDATMDALDLYGTPAWNDIRSHAMAIDRSIDKTADDCIAIYRSLKD